MARKRTKPVAEPIEAQLAPSQPETQTAEPQDAPDVFDQAIAARYEGQFEPAPPVGTSPSQPTPPVEPPPPADAADHLDATGHDPFGAPKHVRHGHLVTGFTSRVEKQPDPFAEYRISLTRDDGGPAMRLYRNRHSNLMAIGFDEKPSDQIRAQLHQSGFAWRQQDRVWVKPLGQRPREEHIRTRELFEELANQIRAENSLPPIEKVGIAI